MKIFKIFDKRFIHTRKRKLTQILFAGLPVIQYIKIRRNKKKKKLFMPVNITKPAIGQRIFYLKVNRIHKTSFDCIQHWVNIISYLNGYIFFVCDNKKLKNLIYKNITFADMNFSFIPSDKKTLKNEISYILDGVTNKLMWQRIAFAMTTAFAHAYKNNYKLSYNIDADDILLYSDAKFIAKAFEKAELYAKENNLDLFNLDMFVSKSFGVHWSFGVVMCLSPQRCFNTLKNNINWRKNKQLINKYKTVYINKFNYNIDWFFTFIRDTQQLRIKTFYIENLLVAHMPDYILEHGWAFMFRWSNGSLKFPILETFYDTEFYNEQIRNIPIYEDCVKIDVDLGGISYKKAFMNFYYWSLYGQIDFQMDMLNYAIQRNKISLETYNRFKSLKSYPGFK